MISKALSDIETLDGDEVVFTCEVCLLKTVVLNIDSLDLVNLTTRSGLVFDTCLNVFSIFMILLRSVILFYHLTVKTVPSHKISETSFKLILKKIIQFRKLPYSYFTTRTYVQVSGDPKPDITWFRNGKELDKKSKDYVQNYDGKLATLTIEDIMTDDTAEMKVVAENNAGKVESSCKLEVKGIYFSFFF